MGCWNETCGITQMPIEAGDPVRMVLIVESEHVEKGDNIVHYNTDWFVPYGLPLKGNYDEYGRLDDIKEDCASNHLLNTLKSHLIAIPNRMGKSYDRETLDWETAIDFLTDEGLFISKHNAEGVRQALEDSLPEMKSKAGKDPHGKHRMHSVSYATAEAQHKFVVENRSVVAVYHMMIHEDIYQALCNYKVPAVRFSSMSEGDLRADMQEDSKFFLTRIREDLEKEKDPNLSDIERMKLAWRRMDSYTQDDKFRTRVRGLSGQLARHFDQYFVWFETKIKEGAADEDAEIQDMISQIIDFACVHNAMIFLRKMWIPQCGKGGQDQEHALFKYLAEATVKLAVKQSKKWDEEEPTCGSCGGEVQGHFNLTYAFDGEDWQAEICDTCQELPVEEQTELCRKRHAEEDAALEADDGDEEEVGE